MKVILLKDKAGFCEGDIATVIQKQKDGYYVYVSGRQTDTVLFPYEFYLKNEVKKINRIKLKICIIN